MKALDFTKKKSKLVDKLVKLGFHYQSTDKEPDSLGRPPRLINTWANVMIDFLPRLKVGDSYTGRLNEALRFGGFLLHGRLRCDRLAPVSVLRRLHGRLMTPRVPRRRGCSMRRSNHDRAVCRIAGIPIHVRPTVSCHPCVRIGSRFGCWDTHRSMRLTVLPYWTPNC